MSVKVETMILLQHIHEHLNVVKVTRLRNENVWVHEEDVASGVPNDVCAENNAEVSLPDTLVFESLERAHSAHS